MKNWKFFLLLYTVFLSYSLFLPTDGAKLLVLFPHSSESHFSVLRRFVGELSRRGHNVTLYTAHRLTERFDNVTEFNVDPEYPFWMNLQKTTKVKGGLEELSALPEEKLQKALGIEGAANMDYFLSNHQVQDLLKLPSEEFDYDLILVDLFYSEALLALGYIHKKPTIALLNNNFENYMERIVDIVVPAPCSHLDFKNDHKSLSQWQQYKAKSKCLSKRDLYKKEVFQRQEKIVEKFFPALKDNLFNFQETLFSDVAAFFINNHVPLSQPRPLLYNTIDVGGLHIRPPRELPWNIRRYLDEDRSGVVYMNLGNEQLCNEIPKSKREILYKAFEDKKVVWTCHDASSVKDAPASWFIQHLIPQADILAHPHIKMFITNGELLSFQEAIIRHVPMLGLPLFREQTSNILLAKDLGIAFHLDESNFTVESLKWSFKEFSKITSYGYTIRKVSERFRDRPLGGLETSMYWIDYILRHNGGQPIKTLGTGIIFPNSFLSWLPLVIIISAFVIWKAIQFILHKRKESKTSKLKI